MTGYAYPNADPTAVLGRRIGAWFIDLGIYLVLVFAVGLAIPNNASQQIDVPSGTADRICSEWRVNHNGFCFHLSGSTAGRETVFEFENTPYPIYVVLGHMVLYALIQGTFSASIGMLLVGLRVVQADGKRCGYWRSFVRTFLWIIDAITFALPIVGGVLMVSTKGHRRAGDFAAGTFVVDKKDAGEPLYIPGLLGTPPPSRDIYGGYRPPVGSGPWVTAPLPDQTTFSGEGPHWDPARNTYIQWDANVSAWLEWDDADKAWKPIST